MSFVTGLMLIDAPASALNNAGAMKDELYGNKVAVKVIRSGGQLYPYVSAQSFRYWLRATLEKSTLGWKSATIYRDGTKSAYTDANPIVWWDDDLFGYMRAPNDETRKERKEDAEYQKLTPLDTDSKGKEQTVTRLSPFRVSTLVAISPANIVQDFESMSRHKEGDAVLYSSQFYRATLKGLFSLDLHACGTFSYRNKTGFRNLDGVRIEIAKADGLTELEEEKAFRLPIEQRVARITTLFDGLACLDGGAKQTLHYTDVAPALVVLAVTKGGNHIFGHIVGADGKGQPVFKIDALQEALTVFEKEILSNVYVGWVRGYLDGERAKLEEFAKAETHIKISHPREAYAALIADLNKAENEGWLD
jgi:CRISPR-associated protein Cst2